MKLFSFRNEICKLFFFIYTKTFLVVNASSSRSIKRNVYQHTLQFKKYDRPAIAAIHHNISLKKQSQHAYDIFIFLDTN